MKKVCSGGNKRDCDTNRESAILTTVIKQNLDFPLPPITAAGLLVQPAIARCDFLKGQFFASYFHLIEVQCPYLVFQYAYVEN